MSSGRAAGQPGEHSATRAQHRSAQHQQHQQLQQQLQSESNSKNDADDCDSPIAIKLNHSSQSDARCVERENSESGRRIKSDAGHPAQSSSDEANQGSSRFHQRPEQTQRTDPERGQDKQQVLSSAKYQADQPEEGPTSKFATQQLQAAAFNGNTNIRFELENSTPESQESRSITVTVSKAPTTPTSLSSATSNSTTTNQAVVASQSPNCQQSAPLSAQYNQGESEIGATYATTPLGSTNKQPDTSQLNSTTIDSGRGATPGPIPGQGPTANKRTEILECELRRIASERKSRQKRPEFIQAPPPRLQVDHSAAELPLVVNSGSAQAAISGDRACGSEAASCTSQAGAGCSPARAQIAGLDKSSRIATILESSQISNTTGAGSSGGSSPALGQVIKSSTTQTTSANNYNYNIAQANNNNTSAAPINASGQQQQQQQQQQTPPSPQTPKQFAIYINGKIRSNSIFCKSSSGTNIAALKTTPASTTSNSNQSGIDPASPNNLHHNSNSSSENSSQDNTNNNKTIGGAEFAIESQAVEKNQNYSRNNINLTHQVGQKQANGSGISVRSKLDSCTATQQLNEADVVRRNSGHHYSIISSLIQAGGGNHGQHQQQQHQRQRAGEGDKAKGPARRKTWQGRSWSRSKFERLAGQVGGQILGQLQRTLHVGGASSNNSAAAASEAAELGTGSAPSTTTTNHHQQQLFSKVSTAGSNHIGDSRAGSGGGGAAVPAIIAEQGDQSGPNQKSGRASEDKERKQKINIDIEQSAPSCPKEQQANNNKQQQHQFSTQIEHSQQDQQQQHQASYKLNPSSMFLRKAMRYYRLWIYCTNIVIFLGTLLFAAATIYVISDYRIKLIVSYESKQQNNVSSSPSESMLAPRLEQIWPTNQLANHNQQRDNFAGLSPSSSSLNYNDNDDQTNKLIEHKHQSSNAKNPSQSQRQQQPNRQKKTNEEEIYISLSEPVLLIAYVAIALQAGILQGVGCFGSIRMKERWIQAFWLGILGLTLFDVIFLVYWLQRYELIVKSLRSNLTNRLHLDYRGNLTDSSDAELYYYSSAQNSRSLTKILDKIQSDSKCCGITSGQDYHWSTWRQFKLKQLSQNITNIGINNNNINWSEKNGGGQGGLSETQFAKIIRSVPFVPNVCCRPKVIAGGPTTRTTGGAHRNMQRLTASHLKWDQQAATTSPASSFDEDEDSMGDMTPLSQVPAWSQSPVIDHLPLRRVGPPPRRPASSGPREAAAAAGEDTIDSRWTGLVPGDNSDELSALSSSMRLRLLNKQETYKQRDDGDLTLSPATPVKRSQNSGEPYLEMIQDDVLQEDAFFPENSGRGRRLKRSSWTVSSSVDEQERVLAWLVLDKSNGDDQSDAESNAEPNGESDGEGKKQRVKDSPAVRLERLRRLLFVEMPEHNPINETGDLEFYSRPNYTWPNELDLTFEQYETIASYLAIEQQKLIDARDHRRPVRSVQRRGRDAAESSSNQNNQQPEAQLASQLRALILDDPELGCAPRAYYDQATIHTQGCYSAVKAWLDSSAHILFVAGFCIMTVLKFCSLVLLRLEIREMIHKIKVLKGMATEYNELNDLEVYLPRSSICPPPIGPVEVGGAAAVPTHGSISGPSAATLPIGICPVSSGHNQEHRSSSATGTLPRGGPSPYRCLGGGSFSDAVVAATAAAQMGAANNGAAGAGFLGSLGPVSLATGGGRAASMKAMAAISSMLSPSLCARSSSAHLPGGGAGGVAGAANLAPSSGYLSASGPTSIYEQRGNNVMYRRHTAVSVCPAAAAAAAATAAHHLMSRRGTYIANPFFNAAPLMNPAMGALSQHRHSAHTVYTLSAPTSNLLSPQHHSSTALQTGVNHATPNQSSNPPPVSVPSASGQVSQFAPRAASLTAPPGSKASTKSNKLTKSSLASADSAGASISTLGLEPATPPANDNRPSSGEPDASSSQLLPLSQHPSFKRQSSAGPQLSGNHLQDRHPSDELAPSPLLESRRSIH